MHWKITAGVVAFCLALLGTFLLTVRGEQETVTIYTSVDRHYSEPVLKAFEAETGISVAALYDVEAAKTMGLVNKLIAEKTRPRADVFWNGEVLQTVRLAQMGLLAPYHPAGVDPAQQDAGKRWTEFGGRLRVLIVNTRLLPRGQWPGSIRDFTSPRWEGARLAISNPLFGTSTTQAATMFAAWGQDEAAGFYAALQDRGVQIVGGNSVVRDMAVRGEILFGLTDTDDACSARAKGAEIAVILPDQGKGEMGTIAIANSVALIKGAANPENGKRLIDYLLRAEVSRSLAKAGWFHADGTTIIAPQDCGLPKTVNIMQVDPRSVLEVLDQTRRDLRQTFVR